jgi:hypothetical protein
MSEQIDIAVDLGVVPPLLPEILNLWQLAEVAPLPSTQIIEGVLPRFAVACAGQTQY